MDYYLCANRLVHTASVAEIDVAISLYQPTPVMDHVWTFRSEDDFQTILGDLRVRFREGFAFLLVSVGDKKILEAEGNHPAFYPSHGGPRTGSAEEVDMILRSSSEILAFLESRMIDLRS